MTRAPTVATLIAILAATACKASAIDSTNSLVGAKQLPSSDVLSRETIQLNRFRYDARQRQEMLVAELRPDNAVALTLTRNDIDHGQSLLGKEEFQLSAGTADRIRNTLWKFRPGKLEGVGTLVLPAGCSYINDETPEAAVAFVAANNKDIGIAELQPDCQTPAAKAARILLGKVLKEFPNSKLAAGFWNPAQPSG